MIYLGLTAPQPLGSGDSPTSTSQVAGTTGTCHHIWVILFIYLETGFHHVGRGRSSKLLTSGDQPRRGLTKCGICGHEPPCPAHASVFNASLVGLKVGLKVAYYSTYLPPRFFLFFSDRPLLPWEWSNLIPFVFKFCSCKKSNHQALFKDLRCHACKSVSQLVFKGISSGPSHWDK
uniref:Uncharacterized protein n=1 Tax=Astyanax mexicanus TaxID=7994 RepID=A0A3B1IXS5_ASTMX